MTAISDKPIVLDTILNEITTPESGGINIFIGTVRNHSAGKGVVRLEYSAYVPMAEKLMNGIEKEMRKKWNLHNVVLVHRIGRLEIGDIAVVTVVSSAHRNEAFVACRYAIDRIKEVVPIWKKEFFLDGAIWVAGTRDSSAQS